MAICKVCLGTVPERGALVVRSAELIGGFSFVVYQAGDYDADTNDLVCGKQCALEIASARLDGMMGIRDLLPARAL